MTDSTILLSTGAVATRLGVSVTLVQRLEKRGDLPPAMIVEGSRRKVWPIDQLPEITRRFSDRHRRDRAA